VTDDYLSESDFVPVWEGPYAEASERLGWLERAHIPVDLGEALLPGTARVEVARGYEDEAREIMRQGPPMGRDLMPILDPTDPVFLRWRYFIALLILIGIIAALVF
jgi:hypothetical protein